MFRSTALVSVFQAATSVAGFANQIVVAYLFGATAAMDAYLAAVSVPGVLAGVAVSAFSFTLVPTLVRHESNQEQFGNIVTTLLLLTVGASVLISGLGIAGSSVLLHYVAGDLPTDSLNLALEISRLSWLAVGCGLLSNFLVAVHHSIKQFTMPALVAPLPALSMIVAVWVLSPYLGIKSLAVGWLISSVLQVSLLLPGVWPRLSRKRLPFSDDAVVQPIKRMVPVIASLLPFTTLQAIEVFWASRLQPGSISYLGYSQKIVVSVGGMLIYGIAVVLFPFMAEDAARGNMSLVSVRVIKGLRLGLLFALPIAGFLYVLVDMFLRMGFQWGTFDERAALGIAAVLPWYLLGMIPMALMNVVIRAYFAKGEFAIPALIGVIAPAVYFVLTGLLSLFFSFVGIGMAYAAYWFLVFVISTLLLKWSIWNGTFLRFIAKLGVASSLVWLTMLIALPSIKSNFGSWGGMAIVTALGAGMLVALVYKVFPIPEVKTIAHKLLFRMRRLMLP
jgi:putative peptidoglycan lipid II flippase